MSRQERVARDLVAKYGMPTARIMAGSRGLRHLVVRPALEGRKVTADDVFLWTFWHCVTASLNKMVRHEVA